MPLRLELAFNWTTSRLLDIKNRNVDGALALYYLLLTGDYDEK